MPKSKPEIPDFGVQFPPNTPLLQRHIYCSYWNRGNGSFWHRRELIRALWPEEVYTWNEWSERRLRSTCDYSAVTWVGSASSGKSTDAACQALEFFWENPAETAVIIASTTMKMLRIRIWSEVQRLFTSLPKTVEFRNDKGDLIERTNLGYLGELLDSDLLLRWKPGDNKHAIFGLAVGDGPVHEAVQNLVGIHARRVWLILDELQGVREAIMSAMRNMSKNPVFKFLGMGNPESNTDLLRRKSEPVNGWTSIDPAALDGWDTDGGIVSAVGRCERFDGRKSPAIADPKKFYFLINQKQIDDHIRDAKGNLNDPGLCSQAFGIWPLLGVESTVLDDAIITKFKCKEPFNNWTNGFKRFAALDPAFEEGGDRKILQFGRYGMVHEDEGDRYVVLFEEWFDVPIDGTLIGDPVHYQIMEFCKEACKNKGIEPEDFAMDSTGEGGGLAAIFEKHWGSILQVEFGGAPSENPAPGFKIVNGQSVPKTAKDAYDRKASEIALGLRTFALGNSLRGLSNEAAEEACQRKTIYKAKKNTVEKKIDLKLRAGKSPDHFDACCVGIFFVQKQGVQPGSDDGMVPRKIRNIMEEMAEENLRMTSEENYLVANY